MTTLNFEGLVAKNSYAEVPDGYGDLHWSNFGVVGSKYIDKQIGDPNGYDPILAGKGMGYAYDDGLHGNNSAISSDGTFTLKSGTFSSLVEDGGVFTFTAYRDGNVVGTQIVTLNEAGADISFNKHFKHVDTVTVTSADNSYAFLGLENLKVVSDALEAPAHAHVVDALQGHDAVHRPADILHHHFDLA